METFHVAMLGALVACCCFAAMIFFRFWRRSDDRFHLLIAIAMLLLAVNWIGVTALRPSGEPHSEIYLVRLSAFLVILAAIVDKNRRA